MVAERIEEFLVSHDPRDHWLFEAVRRWNFLPLYRGWFSVLGIRPDGSFVRWDSENDPGVIKPVLEPYLQRLALCAGARKYPELSARMPVRPYDAITCENCKGLGGFPDHPQLICRCVGCGWIIPGEPQGAPTG